MDSDERALCVLLIALVSVLVVVVAQRKRTFVPELDGTLALRRELTSPAQRGTPRIMNTALKQTLYPYGGVWGFTVGSYNFPQQQRCISSWYTPPEQAVKTGDTPLGMYSVQLYASGILNNLSLVGTFFTQTLTATFILNASVRIAASMGDASQHLGMHDSLWVHNFPLQFSVSPSIGDSDWGKNIVRFSSASNLAQDMPVLYARAQSLQTTDPYDSPIPANVSNTTTSQVLAVLELAFNSNGAAFWERHLHIDLPVFAAPDSAPGTPLMSLWEVAALMSEQHP